MTDDAKDNIVSQPDTHGSVDEQQERLFQEIESMLGEIDSTQNDLCEATSEVRRTHWHIGRTHVTSGQWPRELAISVAMMATLIYLTFRVLFTLNLTSPAAACFSAVLLAAETYGLFHLTLYFYQVWRLVEPPLVDAPLWHSVDVFVTTYNEDVSLLRNTLLACVEMDYPHTTYVLDDGGREEVRQLAESLGIEYIARATHEHAKAGNVNNALRQTDGEFVVILDADHVPHVHFITRLLGYFQDPTLGFVQAPHTTYNLDNFLGHWKAGSRLYWEDVRIFFEAVQLGKNRHGVACFCGSAAIFRREALNDIGLFATETITEDLHTGMRVNAAGWRSLAVDEDLVVGLAPEDPESFCGQRLRWGEGNLSVLAYDNPLTMKGLTAAGRIQYLASILNWTYGPVRLVLYLVPLVMLFTGISPVSQLSVAYIAIVGFYLGAVWTAVKVASNKCGRLLGIEVAMMATFHLHVRALWRALFRRRFQKFVVTAKRRKEAVSGLRLMWPQATIAGLGVLAVTWATLRITFGLSDDYVGLAVGGLLVCYHAWLGLTVLRQALRTRDPDAQWRNPMRLVVDYQYGSDGGRGVSLNFNEDGLSLLTRDRLPKDVPIGITIVSPFSDVRCVGTLIRTEEIVNGPRRMYIHEIAFRNPDPVARQTERDEIAKLSFGYVIPWIIEEHREYRNWIGRPKKEGIAGQWMPLSIEIAAEESGLGGQSSVVERMDRHHLLTTLTYPLNEGTMARLFIRAPQKDIIAEARVVQVQSVRVGVNIVHRHQFEWIHPIPSALPETVRWMKQRRRHHKESVTTTKKRPLVTGRRVRWAAAAAILVAITAGMFWFTYRDDFLLLAAAQRPLTPAETARFEEIVSRARSRRLPPDRLLRMYDASVAVGDFGRAAEFASRLAKKVPEERTRWEVTSAIHFSRTHRYEEADRLLRKVIASGEDRTLPIAERAGLYLEAARVALAVGDLGRSVSLFTRAGDLRTFTQEQVNEYIGMLVSAGDLERASVLLRQLEVSDPILRRIVDVFEIAGRPQAAVPELELLHKRNPGDASAVQRLAELAYLRNEPAVAIRYYRELLDLRPNDIDVRRTLAGILATAGRTNEAIAILQGRTDPESRLLLVSFLETTRRFDKALAELRKIKEKSLVDSIEYRKQLIRLLLATRRYRQAAARCAEYLRVYPEDHGMQQNLIDALASCDLGQFRQGGPGQGEPGPLKTSGPSLESIRAIVRKIYRQYETAGFSQFDSTELARFADVLRRLDMTSEAIDVLTTAVAKYPGARPARLQLAEMLSAAGRYDEAEKHYAILLKTIR